jgi:hypothetical protein
MKIMGHLVKVAKDGCTRIFAIFKQKYCQELTLDNQKNFKVEVF